MPILLGSEYSPHWEGMPPGMTSRDYAVWQEFLAKYKNKIRKVFYNVRCGGGSQPADTASPEDILMWMSITMLRIDAVVEFDNEVWIVEVRPVAERGNLGAVLLYLQLWEADPLIFKPAIGVAVAKSTTPQMQALFDLNNLRVVTI